MPEIMTAPLQLDDRSLILARQDILHVYNHRGAFDLRGTNIGALHARLAPLLRGAHDEQTLLDAVPPAVVSAVRAYFAGLRRAGAVRDLQAPLVHADAHPLADLGPGCPRGRFLWQGHPVEISLDGPLAGTDAEVARLELLSPTEAGRWLWSHGAAEPSRGLRACIVVPAAETPSAPVLQRRAAYARWLLGSVFEPGRSGLLAVFELDAASGDLHRLAAVDRGNPERGLGTLPDQIELVHSAKISQLPLVVARAAHRFFAPSLQAMGLDRATVRGHLLRVFLARLDAAGADPADLLVAASRSGLERAWLELSIARRSDRAGLPWREVDLLASGEAHPALRCLREILRLRRPVLPAREALTPEGAVWIEAGPHRAVSFARGRALAEVLLATVWELFYGEPGSAPPQPALAERGWATPLERRRLREARRPVPARALHRWGITAWVAAGEEDLGAAR